MFVLHLWVGEDSRGDRDPINHGWWGRRSLGLGNSYGKMKEKNIQPEEGKILFLTADFFLSLLKPRFPNLVKYYIWLGNWEASWIEYMSCNKKKHFWCAIMIVLDFLYFTQSYKMYIFVYSSLDNSITWSMSHHYVHKSNMCHIAKSQMWIVLTTQRNPYFDLNFCHSIWMKEEQIKATIVKI